MQISVADGDGAGRIVVSVAGEVDIATVPMLDAAIDELADRAVTAVTLDVRSVTFLDSQGLTAIARIVQRGIAVTVAGANPVTTRLLELSGLESVVKVERPEPPD